MNKIKQIINQYARNPYRYTIKNNVTIVDTDDGRFVFKPNKHQIDISNLYKYLESRNFTYFPKLIDSNQDYNVFSYVDEIDTPNEQKTMDIIYLISLLHNKT